MLNSTNEMPVANKEDILKRGGEVYLIYEDTQKMIYSNHEFADATSNAAPAYILSADRFISGHDDTAVFIEIIDTDGKIARRWMFSFLPLKKRFTEPDLYDDDCLILYLKETYGIPVKRENWYGNPIKVEELF